MNTITFDKEKTMVKQSKVILLVAAALMSLFLAGAAQAMSLWDIDFESATLDATPPYKGTYHSGGGVYEYLLSDDEGGSATNTWTVRDAASYDSDSDSIPDFAAMDGKIAVLVDGDITTRPNLHLYGNAVDLLTDNTDCTYYDPCFAGVYRIEFDLMVKSVSTGTFFGVNLERLGTSTSQGGFSLATSDMRLTLTAYGASGVTVYNAWQYDTLMHIVFLCDYHNETLTVKINGSIIAQSPWYPTEHPDYATGVREFNLGGGAVTPTSVLAVDNILTSIVAPEAPLEEGTLAWDVDFNAMAAGQAPDTAPAIAGYVSTAPSSLTVPDPCNVIEVRSSYTTGTASLSDRPVVFDQTDTGTGGMAMTFRGATADYLVGRDFMLEFDFLAAADSPASTSIMGVYFRRSGTSTILGMLAFSTSSNRVAMVSYDNTNPTVSEDLYNVWTPGVVHHVAFGMDADKGTLAAWLDGVFIGSIDLAPDPANQGVIEFAISNGSYATPKTFAVDNIVTSLDVTDPSQEPIGIPRFDVDFDAMSSGAPPETAGAISGIINDKPTSISNDNPGTNTLLVQDSFTSNSVTMSGKPVVFDQVTGGLGMTFRGATADYSAGKNFVFEFDMMIASGVSPDNSTICGVGFERLGTGTDIAGFAFGDSRQRIALTSNSNVAPAVTETFYDQWEYDTIMHVEAVVDCVSGRFLMWLDDHYVGSVPLVPAPENQGVIQMAFSCGSTAYASRFAVDNIKTSLADYSDTGEVWVGNLAGFNGDKVTVETRNNVQVVRMYDDDAGGTVQVVLDLGTASYTDVIHLLNHFEQVDYAAREMTVKVCDVDGTDTPLEDLVGFDPYADEPNSYAVTVFDGEPAPLSKAASTLRDINVSNIARRYWLLTFTRTYFGYLGSDPDDPAINLPHNPFDEVVCGDLAKDGALPVRSCDVVQLFGLSADADLNGDCYVDTDDLTALAADWLQCSDPCLPGCVMVASRPTFAIVDGTVNVNGSLDEWADATWIDLDVNYAPHYAGPNDVPMARVAFKWNGTTDMVYAAVEVDDYDQKFEASATNWNTSDRIEIYAQGRSQWRRTDWGGTTEDKFYDKAQQLRRGFGPVQRF